MSTITNETKLRLISRLTALSSLVDTDVHVIQRGLKSYKIEHGSVTLDDSNVIYDGDLTGTTVDEALADVSTSLTELYDTLEIPDNTLLGNISGSEALPLPIDFLNEVGLASGDYNAVASQGSIKDYIEDTFSDQLTPYYNVEIDSANNLTDPAQFTATPIVEYSELSYGTIVHASNQLEHVNRSLLYTMNVVTTSPVTVTLKLYAVDATVTVWLNGVSIYSKSSYSSAAPENVSLSLISGANIIEIVKNDSNGGTQEFKLYGDIVTNDVKFVKP